MNQHPVIRGRDPRILFSPHPHKPLDFFPKLCQHSHQAVPEEGTMSTASRNCGTASGTCDGGRNAASIPGAEGCTRGHYDPRAVRQLRHFREKGRGERQPRATNAAPPRKRVQGQGDRPRMSRGPRASLFFPIGLREPRLRHSPPPSLARPPPAGPVPRISAFASAPPGARTPAAAAKLDLPGCQCQTPGQS